MAVIKKTTKKSSAKSKVRRTASNTKTKASSKTPVKKTSAASSARSEKQTTSAKKEANTAKKARSTKTASATSTTKATANTATTTKKSPSSQATSAAQISSPAATPVPHVNIDSDYMDSKQLEHFRALLEDRKQKLMEQAEATVRDMQVANEENQADISDIATTEERWYYQLRTRDRERKLIKKIEESIQKIADKEYGYCNACGIEIGLKRLEVRPTATLCIDCKTLDEIREKTQAD